MSDNVYLAPQNSLLNRVKNTPVAGIYHDQITIVHQFSWVLDDCNRRSMQIPRNSTNAAADLARDEYACGARPIRTIDFGRVGRYQRARRNSLIRLQMVDAASDKAREKRCSVS